MFTKLRNKLATKKEVSFVIDQENKVKETEILYLIDYVKTRMAQIQLDMEHMSDEEMTVHSLSLDALEKSYYYLFNQLRKLRGIPSFEEVNERLTQSPSYTNWSNTYELDTIGKNFKFLGNFNYANPTIR